MGRPYRRGIWRRNEDILLGMRNVYGVAQGRYSKLRWSMGTARHYIVNGHKPAVVSDGPSLLCHFICDFIGEDGACQVKETGSCKTGQTKIMRVDLD
jgi:hypothetical protein